ncbi:hypothetical protein ACJMK2_013818 [Sinanodonta woodiana]|uniref:Uncharacterized protein n=1 Tax=Sinanodonta woodiana TaxID=1069815 RepID=A0ABD3UYQ2_SINWO
MAVRRIIFHWSDGTHFMDDLGYDFTILAAFRKYTCDENSALMQQLRKFIGDKGDIVIKIHLRMNADQAPQAMNLIGGKSVEGYLSTANAPNPMEICLKT